MTADGVFLLDVDNTLLDNDHIIADMRLHLADEFGNARSDRFWVIFEVLRTELGYADYLGAVERYRADVGKTDGGGRCLLAAIPRPTSASNASAICSGSTSRPGSPPHHR